MKRIALVTIFDNPNFGTYLQTFALSSIIEKLGGTVQIVHYERPHWRYWNSLFESFKSVNLLHKISRFCWSIAPYIQKRKEQKFIMNNFSVSRRYNSFEDLKSNPPVADVYLTGSDQVWNSIHNRGICTRREEKVCICGKLRNERSATRRNRRDKKSFTII